MNQQHMLMNKMIELFDPSLHEVKVTEGEKDRSSIRSPSNVVRAGRREGWLQIHMKFHELLLKYLARGYTTFFMPKLTHHGRIQKIPSGGPDNVVFLSSTYFKQFQLKLFLQYFK